MAGGLDDGANGTHLHMSSVRMLLPGSSVWTSLTSLPQIFAWVQGSIVGGKFRITGGLSGMNPEGNEFSEVRTVQF